MCYLIVKFIGNYKALAKLVFCRSEVILWVGFEIGPEFMHYKGKWDEICLNRGIESPKSSGNSQKFFKFDGNLWVGFEIAPEFMKFRG